MGGSLEFLESRLNAALFFNKEKKEGAVHYVCTTNVPSKGRTWSMFFPLLNWHPSSREMCKIGTRFKFTVNGILAILLL